MDVLFRLRLSFQQNTKQVPPRRGWSEKREGVNSCRGERRASDPGEGRVAGSTRRPLKSAVRTLVRPARWLFGCLHLHSAAGCRCTGSCISSRLGVCQASRMQGGRARESRV